MPGDGVNFDFIGALHRIRNGVPVARECWAKGEWLASVRERDGRTQIHLVWPAGDSQPWKPLQADILAWDWTEVRGNGWVCGY